MKDHLSKSEINTLHSAIHRLHLTSISKVTRIGEGAWHTAYKVERLQTHDLVIRIKKKEAYGEIQRNDEHALRTEYESTRAYYQHANKSYVNICPNDYHYFIEDDIVFTVETFMGEGMEQLTKNKASFYGQTLGTALHAIHHNTTAIEGFGELHWNGKTLQGTHTKNTRELWKEEHTHYRTVLEILTHANLRFNTKKVNRAIHSLLEHRESHIQKVSLVNQDITPENILVNGSQIAIIDPFPKLDFDLKYAAYFVFCYKFLLPAYARAPRYVARGYDQKKESLNEIANGFIRGYFLDQTGEALTSHVQRLMDEYCLWLLQEAYEHYERVNQPHLTNKISQQMGNNTMIRARLDVCLKHLEQVCSDMLTKKSY
ncbi:hypothetical protein A374_18019 [Fictibacillus macauensis ZFHKF-1]|uniref:Aminoglycoside phosphotransferase domain-containing protein n=1 Tax=Fictibacillus macauensis ZFHKF-1 TaxID=1196324 RepID=I8AEG6_9BACL|nr:hypothetical protein [Fictibacillus macauensis]EIT83957.1 hypothetical protein A374_18019 [Fictibacillus macauensis ZFHKF-1]